VSPAGDAAPPAPRSGRLRDVLWPETAGSSKLVTYAILDAARDDRIYPAVLGCKLPFCCLYAGKLPQEMLETAPYLVRLERDAPFSEALLRDGWGESWGIFALSTATLEELRRHLRQFLRVEDARGKPLIFRYYDPRVMRVYLPTCNTGELRLLFGPVGLYLMEGEDRATMLCFHRATDGLGEDRVALEDT
jgi:Domain of unknown function (DUF4123)